MKKFLIMTALILGVAALNATQVAAQRIWCCSYLGKDYFIETDSIYDSRPYYFVDVLTKRADLGQPIVGYDKRQWRFNHDEGILWYKTDGRDGTEGRVVNNELATAVYNTMKANLHIAKRGAPR